MVESMKPDSFDVALISSVVLLAGGALCLGMTSRNPATRPLQANHRVLEDLTAARALLDSERTQEAVEHLHRLASENPAVAEVHALLGQAFLSLRDYPSSLREYRMALQLDPDYADVKSEKFAGRTIRIAIREGLSRTRAELARDPGNRTAKGTLKDAHDLERMLAGGCG